MNALYKSLIIILFVFGVIGCSKSTCEKDCNEKGNRIVLEKQEYDWQVNGTIDKHIDHYYTKLHSGWQVASEAIASGTKLWRNTETFDAEDRIIERHYDTHFDYLIDSIRYYYYNDDGTLSHIENDYFPIDDIDQIDKFVYMDLVDGRRLIESRMSPSDVVRSTVTTDLDLDDNVISSVIYDASRNVDILRKYFFYYEDGTLKLMMQDGPGLADGKIDFHTYYTHSRNDSEKKTVAETVKISSGATTRIETMYYDRNGNMVAEYQDSDGDGVDDIAHYQTWKKI